MISLSFDKLSFAYHKDLMVLKDISSSFDSHKIYALLGLNGSGKTTLIKCLAGLLKPTQGYVFLNDQDIETVSYMDRSKYISYVRQGVSTGDDHYVKDYLSFGLMNRLTWYQSPNAEHMEEVVKQANRFNISDLLDKKMDELSGGQKQIVMICRAVIQNTDIIILDEPTSALDVKNQGLVLSLLKELTEQEQKTVIFSTHNPNHALFLNSQVILIDNGYIVQQGSAKEIINVEVLNRIYGDQIKYSDELGYREISIY
jgi:iron complex transport system ATP-binding protein